MVGFLPVASVSNHYKPHSDQTSGTEVYRILIEKNPQISKYDTFYLTLEINKLNFISNVI